MVSKSAKRNNVLFDWCMYKVLKSTKERMFGSTWLDVGSEKKKDFIENISGLECTFCDKRDLFVLFAIILPGT